MEDSIDRIRRLQPQRQTERISAPAPVQRARREHEEEDDFSYEDQVDIAPAEHLQQGPEVIDLSLEMIRALINRELPDEAIEALQSFAPLGDISEVHLDLCLRVEQKGQDFVAWNSQQSLVQALMVAAS